MIPTSHSPIGRRLLAAILAVAALLGPAAPETPAQDDALRMATFEKVWTTVRDRHWDPELGGIDWKAVHDEFEPRVRDARSRLRGSPPAGHHFAVDVARFEGLVKAARAGVPIAFGTDAGSPAVEHDVIAPELKSLK